MPQRRSPTSARSENTDSDPDGAESELTKLQRQFRIMERDHQAQKISAREQIQKQQQETDKLLSEKEELLQNLSVSERSSHQQQDNENKQRLVALLEQKSTVEEENAKELQHQQELKPRMLKMKFKLEELRIKQVTASDSQRSEAQRTQKAKRTLENKLDRAQTYLNEHIAKIGHLREELQTLHLERVRFQQLRNRFEKELQEVRKKKMEIISLTTAAYDARVEAQSKMNVLREKAAKELAQFNSEKKEVERVITYRSNLEDFRSIKCSERSGQEHVHGHRRLSVANELKRMDSSVHALEEEFQRLQTDTGEDNLDVLVTRFIQAEDRNFALFNFVNEQNNMVEALTDQIQQIQREMEEFGVKIEQQEQAHGFTLSGIEEHQKETEFQTEDYESQATIVNNILQEIKTGLNSIFSKLECERSAVEDMLGSSTAISDNNMMAYLGLLEQKIIDLLLAQAFLNSEGQRAQINPKGSAQTPQRLQKRKRIPPPVNMVDCEADEPAFIDEEEQPFSQEELRKRILESILQNEGSVRQATGKASASGEQPDDSEGSVEDEQR